MMIIDCCLFDLFDLFDCSYCRKQIEEEQEEEKINSHTMTMLQQGG